MNACKEFELDDVMAVTAIPVEDYTGWTDFMLSPVISASGFSPSLANAIVIGQAPAVPGGTLIPIVRQTGKAKDSEEDAVAGRKHGVTVNCEVDDRDSEVWNSLFTLERTPSHLILTYRGGTRAFVAATIDTYQCEVERDGAKTSVSFKIDCLAGLQIIA